MPRRLDSLVARTLRDARVDAAEATELISRLKADDVLTPEERATLSTLLTQQVDRFEPEARRMVAAFLEGGTPLSRGVLPDPNLSWDTRVQAELKTPRGASLYIDGVHFDDVVQNQLGDCFLLASLSAIAAVSPETIERALTAHPDGTYTVRFYEKQRRGPPTPVDVTIDADLPANRRGALLYGHGRDERELWPALVEKAWASWKGGYSELALGGFAGDALEALTGRKAELYNPVRELESRDLWKLMVEAHAQGRALVTGTGKAPIEGLVPMHMYAVVGVREENGERLVTVRNPYGAHEPVIDGADDGVFELTLKEYRKHFEDLYVLQAA